MNLVFQTNDLDYFDYHIIDQDTKQFHQNFKGANEIDHNSNLSRKLATMAFLNYLGLVSMKSWHLESKI